MGVPQRFVLRPHHLRAAYLLAIGKRVGEVAEQLSMSPVRISELKRIDEFNAQIEVFRNEQHVIETDEFRQVKKLQATIAVTGLEMLLDQMEREPDKFPKRDLIALISDCLDRMGLSKVSRQESISMSVDLADSLAEARRRELKLVKPNDYVVPVDEGKD